VGATYFLVDEIEFPDEAASPTAPRELVEDAQRSGARRKYLARGEGGFFSQVSWFPPGYTVPPHRHDHDELIMVVAGSLTMLDGGPTLGPLDSMVLSAGHEYGFTAGPDGMTITTIRTAPSAATIG
jgi:quercetin dioxygenase-like cupin family protein